MARPPMSPAVRPNRSPALARHVGTLAVPAGIVSMLLLWQLAASAIQRPYLLPYPGAVLTSLVTHRAQIAWHAQATLAAVLLGFALGFGLATVLGYVISRSPTLEQLLAPYLVGSQAVPVVAIAPLLVLWLGGNGLAVKVVTAALIVFFPVLINTVVGLRNVEPAYRDLLWVMSANRRHVLWHLELPAALPILLGGLRVGLTLAVIGAVVGEFLGTDRGLGALIQVAGSTYNDALMFAALFTLATVALTLYGAATVAERVVLRDRHAGGRPARP